MAGSDAPLALDRAERVAAFSAREPRGSELVGLTVRDRAIMLHDTDTPLVKPAAGRRAGPDAGRAPKA